MSAKPNGDPRLRRELERSRSLMREHGFEIERVVPIVGVRCAHPAGDLRIVGRGRVGLLVRCRCGLTGMFVPVPERPLRDHETDTLVALAREVGKSWAPP